MKKATKKQFKSVLKKINTMELTETPDTYELKELCDTPADNSINEHDESPEQEEASCYSEETALLFEPAQNLILGDMTPDYVLWYGLTHTSQEFNKKYSNRRFRIPVDCHRFFPSI